MSEKCCICNEAEYFLSGRFFGHSRPENLDMSLATPDIPNWVTALSSSYCCFCYCVSTLKGKGMEKINVVPGVFAWDICHLFANTLQN
jgi:hypothetical protein